MPAEKRIFAIVLLCAVVAAVLFSSVFIVVGARHECAGDDCVICAMLSECENLLRGVMSSALVVSAAAAVSAAAGCTPAEARNRMRVTPVVLRVKLTD